MAVYSMAGNLGAGFRDIGTKDDYDGGSGYDTLVLQLTHGEALLGSVKQDIAAFQKFLDSRANARGGPRPRRGNSSPTTCAGRMPARRDDERLCGRVWDVRRVNGC